MIKTTVKSVLGISAAIGIVCFVNAILSGNPHVSRSIVKVLNFKGNSGGTGWLAKTKRGAQVIVTNDHVCEVATGNTVRIDDAYGKTTYNNIVTRDFARDLCLIEGIEGPSLSLASTGPKRFDEVNAFGHPLLEPSQPTKGLYIGDIVTMFLSPRGEKGCPEGSTSTDIETFFGTVAACEKMEDLSLTNMPTYPGNSGSPVLNQDGKVIGVINSGDSRDNHGAYIPLPYVRNILSQ
jgi:S1-C subfamily serine protease